MATLRKRKYKTGKSVWIIDYYDGAKRRIRTIGPVDKRTAEQILNQFRIELKEQEFGIERFKDILISQFIELYLDQAKIIKSESTVSREIRILNNFISFVGDIGLSQMITRHALDYRNFRISNGLAPTTVNIEHRHLKAIFNWAINQGYLKKNPFAKMKQIKVPESELPRFFEKEEIVKVRALFKGDQLEKLVEFYLLTGCRLSEPLLLTWDHIDKRRKTITIPGSIAKSKKNRMIFFGDDEKLANIINTIPRFESNHLFGKERGNSSWSHFWVGHAISKKLSDGGFPWATCHTFRHTYISHLVMNGVPIAISKRDRRPWQHTDNNEVLPPGKILQNGYGKTQGLLAI